MAMSNTLAGASGYTIGYDAGNGTDHPSIPDELNGSPVGTIDRWIGAYVRGFEHARTDNTHRVPSTKGAVKVVQIDQADGSDPFYGVLIVGGEGSASFTLTGRSKEEADSEAKKALKGMS